jgi:conjugative transfer signal peptidase TraF
MQAASATCHWIASRHRSAALIVATIGVALIGIGPRKPHLVFNATASAPIGFYRVLPVRPLQRGDLVLVPTPVSVRSLAAERHYVPLNVPLVKRIAALPGATVCAAGSAVSIDGRHVADRLSVDRQGRPLPAWTGCRVLAADEIFLLMEDVPDSFDGRYFGPVPAGAVIGRLSALWLR